MSGIRQDGEVPSLTHIVVLFNATCLGALLVLLGHGLGIWLAVVERIFIELMTSDRKLKASREGSK